MSGCCIGDYCIADCGAHCNHCGLMDLIDTWNKSLSNEKNKPQSGAEPSHLYPSDKLAALKALRQRGEKDALTEETAILKQLQANKSILQEAAREIGKRGQKQMKNVLQKQEKLEAAVPGFVKSRVAGRLWLADKDVYTILSEEDETLRQKNLEEFYLSLQLDVVSTLREYVRQEMREIQAMFSQILEDWQAEATRRSVNLARKYDKLAAAWPENSINLRYRLDIDGIVLSLLENARNALSGRHE